MTPNRSNAGAPGRANGRSGACAARAAFAAFAFAFAAILTSAFIAGPAAAQIVTDGSVGARVDLRGDAVRIEDGLGRRNGGNLLHSFDRFNVNSGQAVTFSVPGGVDAVIGRVTGGEASRLDGIVSFAQPGSITPAAADFWFFNPAGVLIGPGARFLTGGALRFSGGDGVVFGDGARLSANLEEGLTLTSAPPEAFGFFDADPGPVIVRGAALRSEGASIAFAGGEIAIEGGELLSENGGDLVIIAGGRGDEAPVLADGFDPGSRPTAGSIRLAAASSDTPPLNSRSGGDVVLSAGVIEATGGAVLTSSSTSAGGDVFVRADTLTLANGAAIRTATESAFDAGAIDVVARDVTLLGGAAIRSQTSDAVIGAEIVPAAGNAGPITITGFESLFISRDGVFTPTLIASDVFSTGGGDAGLVRIAGEDLRLEDGGRIFSTTLGAGDAGAIEVEVARLIALGGGQIGSGALDADGAPGSATGAGGSLTVTAREEARFGGVARRTAEQIELDPEPEPSGLFTSSEGINTGAGGTLRLSAPMIVLTDLAEVGAETFADAPAGDIFVTGDTLRIDGGAELSTSSRQAGRAGSLTVDVTGGIFVDGDRGVASRAPGEGGAAGGVFLTATEIRVGEGGRVTTESGSSDGGRISLTASDLTVVDGGVVTTSVGGSDGDGGAISVNGGPLVLKGSALLASTAVFGDGGEVVVGSDFSLIEPGSRVDVSSLGGADGVVEFLGVVGDQTTETEAPPAEFFNRFALIDDFCVAAVTGGSALRLEGPRAPAGGGSPAPALFGDAVPFPGGAAAGSGEAGAAALRLAEDVVFAFGPDCVGRL